MEAPKTDEPLVAKVKAVSGIELVSIPKGSFYMGSPEENGRKDEKPQHKVTISKPFFMGKYKVTVGQFKRFVAATDYKTEAEKDKDENTWKNPGFEQTDEHPVIFVSWNDADAYCQWLTKETGAIVRLPSEAEWEYSCRAVTVAIRPTTKFYFGDDEKDLEQYAWYNRRGGLTTKPCGQKKPNDVKLYDMHGLVYEWCADGKREYKNQDETDPLRPIAGASRVIRGSGFYEQWEECRAAYRGADAPSLRACIGFRVVVSR